VFASIQSFSKQLDLSVLGNQPRKEELMNGSSRFARHRSSLEFCKDLVGSIDQHLGILELEAGIDIEHGLEKGGDRVSASVLDRKSERRKIRQLKGAIFGEHLRRLLRISEREGGVFKHEFLGVFHRYFSCSRPLVSPNCLQGSRNSRLRTGATGGTPGAEPIRARFAG
jgi:hypothetical protein